MKYTDEQIIKALECCGSKHTSDEGEYSCLKCPLNELNDCNCFDTILHDLSLDLINRQKAEIERLEKGELSKAMTFNSQTIKRCVNEAVKEFGKKPELSSTILQTAQQNSLMFRRQYADSN